MKTRLFTWKSVRPMAAVAGLLFHSGPSTMWAQNAGAPGVMPRPQANGGQNPPGNQPPPGGGQTGGGGQQPQGPPPPPPPPVNNGGTTPPLDFDLPDEFRSIDGSGNNAAHPEWGMAGQVFLRMASSDYADGANAPAGADRPSARAISNAVAVLPPNARLNRRGASDMLWEWGQFIDHDITETTTAVPEEAFDIVVPLGDPSFDPNGTGAATIGLNRSTHAAVDGVRQQVNSLSSFIDGSNVYGSDAARASGLRALDGTGRMRTSTSDHGDLLPLNTTGLENIPPGPDFFVAGDVRANEQPGLLVFHTLFVREHNHWADTFRQSNPDATDDEIYEFARMMVIAELQAITYREWLPILVGPRALRPYRGYKPEVNPSISNEFAAAAYRFGHSLISSSIVLVEADGSPSAISPLGLKDAFFNPSIVAENGIDSLLRGMTRQRCQELDEWVVDDVRNFLFGAPGSGGLDLAALNIQRGRDHGLPSFNAMRAAVKLRPAKRFQDINPSRVVVGELTAAYSDPDQVDLWVGGLSERKQPGSMLGLTFHRIVVDQFTRLRDGDRFWYQSYLPKDLVRLVEQQSLVRIIERNTAVAARELPRNVWIAPPPPKAGGSQPPPPSPSGGGNPMEPRPQTGGNNQGPPPPAA